MPVNTSITFRKGSSTQWSNTNPVLASGEPGYDLTNSILKIGDGTSSWNSLNNHQHSSIDITDFNSSVSGLLPVKNIVAGTDISVSSLSGIFTITNTRTDVDRAGSIVTNVFNNTGSPIPKMAAVYINGGQGDQPTIQLAIATGDATSAATYGLTYESIENMSAGRVVIIGALNGVNTDQFNPSAPVGNVNGQILYLSPTISGGLTTVKPSAPNHIVSLGTIVRTHQNEGVIEVRVQNGFELDELHNVAISGATSGQFLQYNSVSGLWVPSSSGNFSTLQVNGTGVSINGHTHNSSDITDFNSSVSGLVSGIYQPLLTNPVTGVGTSGYYTKWNGSNSVTSGIIFDNGSRIGINNPAPSSVLDVIGESRIQGLLYFNQNSTDANDSSRNRCSIQRSAGQNLSLTGGSNSIQLAGDAGKILIRSSSVGTEIGGDGANTYVSFHPGSNVERARITSAGFLGIGTSTPSGQLHVVGTGIVSSRLGVGTTSPSVPLDVVGNANIDGNLVFDSFTESVVAIGNSSTSQTLSLTNGTVQTCTLTNNCTFSMPTVAAGKSFTMFLNTGSGNYTASFSGVLWSDSSPPTITTTTSKTDILSFISDGSYWYGSYSQNYG